jgi:hypothetical protein
MRLFILLVFALTPCFAQADVSTATLKGTVTDGSNAVAPSVTVIAKDKARGIERSAVTASDGSYVIPLLPPGDYEVRATKQGFKTFVAPQLTATVGETFVLDIKLELGAVSEEMIVEATVQQVEVERTQQANTISERLVDNLPNVSRDFTSYVFTLPGVSSSQAPRTQHQGFTFGTSGFSIGGSNGRNNLVTIDGGENELGSGQLRISNLSVEAIQEFQVNRNGFAAEFGFTAGTAVNVVTKSGSNDFHGSAYTFFRSQRFGARNYFNSSATKAFDQNLIPGFTLGGAAIKNKLFYFFSYEYLKSDQARFRSYTNNPAILGPSAAQADLLGRLDSSADTNVRRIGATLRGTLSTANFPRTLNFLRANENPPAAFGRFHTPSFRMDYQATANDSINGRFTLSRRFTDDTTIDNSQGPSNAFDTLIKDYTGVVTWNHTFEGGRTLNQARVQVAPGFSAVTAAKAPGTAQINIAGIASFNRNFGAPLETYQNRFQFENIVAMSRGRHNIKFGASLRPVNYRVRNELWFGGQWDFNGGVYPLLAVLPAADAGALIGALGGQPSALTNLTALQSFNLGLPFLYRQGFGTPEWKGTATFLGTFLQDSWKITPRFSLDYGVRWDYDNEPAPLKTYNFFSPRLGFAWDPMGDQKTVVRGGGGLFFSPVYYQVTYLTNLLNDSGQYINQIFRTPAFPAAQTPAALWGFLNARGRALTGTFAEAELQSLGVNTGRGNAGRVIFEADPNYRPNYSGQANFGIERQLAPSTTLDVAWNMYRGVAIQTPREVNYRQTGVVDPLFGPQLTAIDPTIAQRNVYASIGNSIYHGLTVSLTKKYSRNFQMMTNYTWSKAIDDTTDFNSAFSAFLPTNLQLERALSVFDIRHNFVASGVWNSPYKNRFFGDISIAPIISARTGIPFTARVGRDVNGDNRAQNDRPFAASRNTGIGPGFFSADLRVTKQFFINRERGIRAEFIAEGTNLTNRTNFLAVNDVIGSDPTLLRGPFNFEGRKNVPSTAPLGFTAASDARRLQFGVRMAW